MIIKHKLLIVVVFVGFLLFLVWLGGLFIFNRMVFAYVQSHEEKYCLHFGAGNVDCLTAEKATEADELARDYAWTLYVTMAVMKGRFVAEKETSPAGIAVLTGGKNRIAKAMELLNRGYGERLLISGVPAGTTLNLIVLRPDVRLESGQPIDLGYEARDTVGNAREVRAWAQEHGMSELFVVTSFYHIPRSRLELEHEMPNMKMHFVAADTPDVAREWWKNKNSLLFLAVEYTKFLLVYVQYRILRL